MNITEISYRTHKLLLFIILATLLNSCCKCDDPANPDCPNYDPCLEVNKPVADFGAGYIYSYSGHEDFNNFYPDTTIILSGDTIPATCTFFSYNTDVDSFYWKVGQDPRVFRGKEFYLQFGENLHLKTINVELIVFKKSDCFEGGFITDTLSKNLVITSKPFESPSIPYFNNKYSGISNEFPNDTFEIEFKDGIEWIVNMPRGTNGNTALYRRDFDEVFFTGQSDSTIWMGDGRFQPDNRRKVVIRYKVSYDLGKTVNWYTYTGYRID